MTTQQVNSKELSNAAAHVMLIIFAHCAFCAKFLVGVEIAICSRVKFLYNIELSYRYKRNYQAHFDLKTAKDHTYILFTTTLPHTEGLSHYVVKVFELSKVPFFQLTFSTDIN